MTENSITATEAAVRIGISREAMVRKVQRGECRGEMLAGRWFVPVAEVDRLLDERPAKTA